MSWDLKSWINLSDRVCNCGIRLSVAKVVKAEDDNVFVKIKHWFSSVLEYIGA